MYGEIVWTITDCMETMHGQAQDVCRKRMHRMHGNSAWTSIESMERMYGHAQNVWIQCMDKHRMYGYLFCTQDKMYGQTQHQHVWTSTECVDICVQTQNVWRDCRDVMYEQTENVWTWI